MNTVSTRKPARSMLALIALATDLPMPEAVHLYEDTGILALSFVRVADGQTWVRHFGAEIRVHVSEGKRYVGQLGAVEWRGWQVSIGGSEPVVPDAELSSDDQAALTELAGAQS